MDSWWEFDTRLCTVVLPCYDGCYSMLFITGMMAYWEHCRQTKNSQLHLSSHQLGQNYDYSRFELYPGPSMTEGIHYRQNNSSRQRVETSSAKAWLRPTRAQDNTCKDISVPSFPSGPVDSAWPCLREISTACNKDGVERWPRRELHAMRWLSLHSLSLLLGRMDDLCCLNSNLDF